ncbi:hypothetical protein GJAV_G00050120 [Gymnothorax javanicus]|nr:hypothetical protein GJAV_G00050120 [Gymnothorax javanicus]
MVGCSAVGCTNRFEQGFRMYGFPNDPERRRRWLVMVGRKNFDVTKDSNNRKLCQAHFEQHHFMSTKRGGLKLTPDAVPSVFEHRLVPRRRKSPPKRIPPAPLAGVGRLTDDHSYCTPQFGRGNSPCSASARSFKEWADYKVKSLTGPADWQIAELSVCIMTERKAVIKNADMPEDMQQEAVECATQALEKYNIEKDIAAFIKKEFDRKYNPTWHCIVGRNFGSYVTHETKHFIYFYLGQVAILLFKSG